MKCILTAFFSLFFSSIMAVAGERTHSAQINSDIENNPLDEYFETQSVTHENQGLIAQSMDASDAANSKTATSDTPSTTGSSGTGKSIKKKKKKADAAQIDVQATLGHGEQESGLPYKAAVDLSLWYMSGSKTQKYSNESFKISSTNISIEAQYLVLFGRFEIGPTISYTSETLKQVEATTSTYTTTGTAFGAAIAVNFGNIHQEKMVPFISLDIDRYSQVLMTKVDGSSQESKTTDTVTRPAISAGAKIFMGGHLALKPMLQYQLMMGGEHKTETSGDEAVVASVTGNVVMLGMGLAKYF